MLQTIGKHIQGWIAGVVIAVVAAAFILLGLQYYISRGGEENKAAATVNGVKILPEQVKNAYEALQQTYTQQGKTLSEQSEQQLHSIALEQLILDQVLLQTVAKMGFTVSPAQVRQAVMQIPDFQENGRFSQQKFQQLLSQNNIPPEAFFGKIQQTILANQILAGIQNSSFATANEIEKVYDLLNQKRSFGYFMLPTANFIAAAKPSDAQINSFYEQHKDEFFRPEQVKVAYLHLSPENLKSQIKMTPQQMQAYYQENKSTFGNKTFDAAKPEIEQRLSQQTLSQLLASKSERLQELTYTNPHSLEEASQSLQIPIKTSDWMTKEGIEKDPIFSDPKIIAAVFSDDVLQQKNNSYPLELKDGGIIVLRVAEDKPLQSLTLPEVRDQIFKYLQKEKGEKDTGLQAYLIQHALESNEDPKVLAGRYHLNWIEQQDVSRFDKKITPSLLTAVFNLVPSAGPAKKSATSVLMSDGNYAIILLKNIQNGDYKTAAPDEKEKLRTQLAGRYGELDYQLFTKNALDKSKVVIGGKNGH
jgi:hypothetical protein